MNERATLRRQLRARRAAFETGARRQAQRLVLARLQHHPRWLKANRVALYLGHGGEVDPSPLALTPGQPSKRWYLPVLHPFAHQSLWFHRWHPGERLLPNRFGIGEPPKIGGRLMPVRHLDLVIVPLLGFDKRGSRLGMGGGFYDRTFAFVHTVRWARRPYLLGLAFDFQQVEMLDVQAWDVRLDGLVTESRVLDFA